MGARPPGPGHGGVRDILEASGDDSIVRVHVQPRSGRTAVAGRHGDALRVRVAEPPVEGRATEAARRALADALGLSPSRVALAGGARSRLKRFRLEGLTVDEAAERLEAVLR